jgi:transketolase C-terminal domain/subunit
MTSLEVGAAIIAVTEAIKRAVPQVSGIVTIAVAALLGVAAGLAGLGGLNWLSGLAVGLASSGTVNVASKIGSSK